ERSTGARSAAAWYVAAEGVAELERKPSDQQARSRRDADHCRNSRAADLCDRVDGAKAGVRIYVSIRQGQPLLRDIAVTRIIEEPTIEHVDHLEANVEAHLLPDRERAADAHVLRRAALLAIIAVIGGRRAEGTHVRLRPGSWIQHVGLV